jgi:dTDP-glucose pyrophosphorylase
MGIIVNDLYLINPNVKVKDAVDKLKNVQCLIVVDENKKLLGTFTDGDFRRALLNNIMLEDKVLGAMCRSPLSTKQKNLSADTVRRAKKSFIKVIPLVDENNIVKDVCFIDHDLFVDAPPVVIMAGGLGSRLGELTKDCPKPMLEISGKPLLQIILERLLDQGFSTFYFAVNFKAEVIENYFEDGSSFGCTIKYLKENIRLGTAGSLSLLPRDSSKSFLVMNGDLLTNIDFRNLVSFHDSSQDLLTVGVRKYDFQVPYGVVSIEDNLVSKLSEKPLQSFFVNAGVYIVNSSLLDLVPQDQYFDMTTLINDLVQNKKIVKCFPIIENWIDIGHIDDLNEARGSHEG